MTIGRPRPQARLAATDTAWLAMRERSGRNVALVIADEPLATVIAELYRAYGYVVYTPATPLDVIQTLIGNGARIGAAVISPDARWSEGVRDFIADEYPELDCLVTTLAA